ncbi:hypothetical protein HOLleu_15880 [Holothuria leucospilota]|uniref:Uncharacterized protein n=1 Tax=Holothuria leucospilota TaxID=206669 RepID=A0A9Q1C5H7_HOLLE|nr:hypothetical protein HOLleu_15880 [Holothuria leucospilota]
MKESDDDAKVTLLRSDVIPQEYVQVSNNPDISKQCIGSTSYWLEGNPFTSRVRRAKSQSDTAPVEPAQERDIIIIIWDDDGVIIITIRC